MPVRPLSTRARSSSRTQPNHARSNRGQVNRTQPNRAQPNRVQPNRVQPDSAHPNRANPHQVICAECGTPTTVPFVPTSGKPVYCRACFSNRRGGPPPVANKHFDEPFVENETPVDAVYGNGPVFSEMPLKDSTRAAISRMDISQPTPIQEKAIPHLLEGRDVKGQARTGSGKTLAFAVPMAEKCDPTVRRVQALVLVPTRELAIQVAGVVEALASPQKLRVTLLYGGRSLRPEYTALRNGSHIIIGTPGRTLDHLRQGTLNLQAVRFLVLDEADEMLDRGFTQDVEAILDRTPPERQTALFSATMPSWVAKTSAKHMREPVTVALDARMQAPPTVEHLIYTIQKSDKLAALQTLLDQREGAPVLVFGKTKHGVKHLAQQLATLGYPVGALQGNLSQPARERVMKDFRSGSAPILVATNVAARGLDIEGIGRVINYDLPDSEQLFTHRVGRTGRMGRAGEAVTFITIEEERKWREIERGLGRRFTRKPWTATRKPTQPRIKVS